MHVCNPGIRFFSGSIECNQAGLDRTRQGINVRQDIAPAPVCRYSPGVILERCRCLTFSRFTRHAWHALDGRPLKTMVILPRRTCQVWSYYHRQSNMLHRYSTVQGEFRIELESLARYKRGMTLRICITKLPGVHRAVGFG